MNTDNIHPMVMKAARAMAEHESKLQGRMFYAQSFFATAQAALTACGALECLEALERMTYKDNFGTYRALIVAGSYLPRVAESALSKVYGSAPE